MDRANYGRRKTRPGQVVDEKTRPALVFPGAGVVTCGVARDRLSLETGSGPAFAPAIALYRKFGVVEGSAFADYVKSPFNQFLHLDLTSNPAMPDGDTPQPHALQRSQS
jgi:hypothetical protein